MDKDSRDNRFIRKPIYPGGQKAYKEFIAKNLSYPEEAKKNKIEGQVRLRYGISYQGDVTEVKVLSSLGYGCDEEAIRIVKMLKFEVPKGPKKLRVLFHKTVRINFKMTSKQVLKTTKQVIKTTKPKITQASRAPMSVTYKIVTDKNDKDDSAPGKRSYSYQIKYDS